MTSRKTEFWWASIHGADPEPVEKTEHEGRACVYTLGCDDPFYLDEPGIEQIERMTRPLLPDQALAAQASEEARRRAYNAKHGWRGPR